MMTKPKQAASAKTIGRPTLYSDALAERICERMAAGESLTRMCGADGIPDLKTIWRWMRANEAFAQRCARARVDRADTLLEEMADIEADTLDGKIDPHAARAVLSSKQWRASKMSPTRYGDRLAVDAHHTHDVVGALRAFIEGAGGSRLQIK